MRIKLLKNYLIHFTIFPTLIFLGGCSSIVDLIEEKVARKCDSNVRSDNWHNCKGYKSFSSGARYQGYFMNGKRNGEGTYKWPNGDEYKGEWFNGKQNGEGTYKWPNGNVYKGEWSNGKRNGEGTLTWSNGDIYKGEWVNSKRTGLGTFIKAN